MDYAFGTKCEFCDKDFKCLNRHKWRWGKRLNRGGGDENDNDRSSSSSDNRSSRLVTHVLTLENPENIQCVCGKTCKGRRGLAAHQRSCKVLFTRSWGIPSAAINSTPEGERPEDQIVSLPTVAEQCSSDSSFISLPGIKLPKSSTDWSLANTYFHAHLNELPDVSNLSQYVPALQSMIYNYFKSNFGLSNAKNSNSLPEKYSSMSANQLRKSLKQLKSEGKKVDEIKAVSKLLRTKFKHASFSDQNRPLTITDKDLTTKFWHSVKKLFNSQLNNPPSFDITTAWNFFLNILRGNSRLNFTKPEWLNQNIGITEAINTEIPTYGEVATAINKMRNRSAPSPFDQVNVIMLKKCPILKTAVHAVIKECFRQSIIPICWKRALTILIYKKGDSTDPGNFRPITLQPVMYKVLSSVVRNRLYSFMTKNHILDTSTQKGFIQHCDGVTEHTEMLSYILSESKRYQRSIAIAALDLKNAFGEINHNLIFQTLKDYKVDISIINLIKNIYTDYLLKVAVKDELTRAIPVTRGVLQGDPLSPLLFNICFNSLMVVVNKPQYRQHGYILSTTKSTVKHPTNWLQFADDALAIARDPRSLQYLLDIFSAWCNWADMKIRPDKCCVFAARKQNQTYIQYEPILKIHDDVIPPVKINCSFKYLGKVFNFDNSPDEVKNTLKQN